MRSGGYRANGIAPLGRLGENTGEHAMDNLEGSTALFSVLLLTGFRDFMFIYLRLMVACSTRFGVKEVQTL